MKGRQFHDDRRALVTHGARPCSRRGRGARRGHGARRVERSWFRALGGSRAWGSS
ncbi:hypothetical protein D187_007554 [Cystobacter fuscus DSM 2262]|uniref:Uncharacterized protein n=1 Tax=Cystobacter fuscus (strain ATCC 25194 / DSM 2262 / NBRC 100088 / M29) TaxID=1242864 RepID=S9P1S5_CYSF2|nr:hypothetical protein D187_007554 [Cystobacter fuscus DSM 2262]